MTLWGIVVAAGSGTRFGGPKHHALLDGIALWERGRASLLDAGAEGVIVVGDVPGGVPGGTRRRDSVANGLGAVPDDAEYVLVHDAARPLASGDLVARVLARLLEDDVDAVVPVVPVTDAVKTATGAAVPRAELRIAQTPQGFKRGPLAAAHRSVGGDAADDAELIERNGGSIALVDGEAANIKITVPSDLTVAAALIGNV